MTTLLETGGPPAAYPSIRVGRRRLQAGSGAGLGIGAILELAILRPFTNHLLRWRTST